MNEVFDYCSIVGKTDVGQKRTANEDSMGSACTINGLVAVVCDGMGGHVGGAVASKIAVETIIRELSEHFYADPRIAIGESISMANQAILHQTAVQPELSGMGSTCVLLIVRDGKVYIGHVGDSRIYLVRSRIIKRLTKDHSYVQMLVDNGTLTEEEAERHPRKNEILNALGISNMKPATVAEEAYLPEAGDCFILCSDGLSGMISEKTICNLASKQSEMSAQTRVDEMVKKANENGGLDNITVQMVEFSVTPGSSSNRKRSSKSKVWIAVSLFAIFIALLVGLYLTIPTIITSDDTTKQDTVQMEISCESDLEIDYSDNITIIKWGENGKKTLDCKCSWESLKLDSGNVEIKYNNSLLTFNENQGDFVFCLSSVDNKKLYRIAVIIQKTEVIVPPTDDLAKQIITNTNPEKLTVNLITIEESVAKGDVITFDIINKIVTFKGKQYSIELNNNKLTPIEGRGFPNKLWKIQMPGKFAFEALSEQRGIDNPFIFKCEDKNGKQYNICITLKFEPLDKPNPDSFRTVSVEFSFDSLTKGSKLLFEIQSGEMAVSIADEKKQIQGVNFQGCSIKFVGDNDVWKDPKNSSDGPKEFRLSEDLNPGTYEFTFECVKDNDNTAIKIIIVINDTMGGFDKA